MRLNWPPVEGCTMSRADLRRLLRAARARGWSDDRTNGGHLRMTHQNGATAPPTRGAGVTPATAARRALVERQFRDGAAAPARQPPEHASAAPLRASECPRERHHTH